MGECSTADHSFGYAAVNSCTLDSLYQLQHDNEAVEKLKFIAYGILSSIIIALGILGNIINLVVLTRPNLKGVTFVYLTWLAISDLMSLLISISSLLRLRGLQPRSYAAAIYYAHIEMPLVNAFMASSVFLVISLTVDRYFSVCLPTRFKEVHNAQRAKRLITIANVCAFLLYVPVCFQKQTVAVHLTHKTEYIACDNPKVVSHTAFKVYLMAKEVMVRLGPVVLLAVLNTTIIITFRKTLQKKKEMMSLPKITSQGQQIECSTKQYREERRLLSLLAGIVILFFVTMTPASILTILNSDDKELHFGFQLFRALANILELSNYSMNFYVYCMCSSEIRRTFLALVTCSILTPNVSSVTSKPSFESNSKF